jgi:hypothetical protein
MYRFYLNYSLVPSTLLHTCENCRSQGDIEASALNKRWVGASLRGTALEALLHLVAPEQSVTFFLPPLE